MVYSHKEMLDKYKSNYNINKAIKNKEIYKLEKGIYSEETAVNPFVVYSKKYPKAIITMDSAFYFYNLTDVIPSKTYLAVPSNFRKINSDKIVQIYVDKNNLNQGKVILKIQDGDINIYNKERLLVELIRKKNKIPYDYYKEIILNYREISNELDMYKIEEYLDLYGNDLNIFETIKSEVF